MRTVFQQSSRNGLIVATPADALPAPYCAAIACPTAAPEPEPPVLEPEPDEFDDSDLV